MAHFSRKLTGFANRALARPPLVSLHHELDGHVLVDAGSPSVYFDLVSRIENVETIAVGLSIRELARLRARYGGGRWRKRKGIATVRLADGTLREAELHWYEAHGIGRRKLKIKRFID